eukprot:CAMPEP_0201583370 /NCGR_PEP_ID=MMETSP0190_2-20130828/97675_1 /ASSEMBLY_ACC=CAM_ASM_000263 /TAXON_ID=37353 /ORGANISM="Rosalina sp." /LENGTH=286 /DNA_ID=CAMNT_0048025119 /DNA_START=28 /DNA_END=885 /DNA_ORIENTATION=-
MDKSSGFFYLVLFAAFNLSVWYFAVDTIPTVTVSNATKRLLTANNETFVDEHQQTQHEYWKNDSFDPLPYVNQLYHDLQQQGQTVDTFNANISDICRRLISSDVSGAGPGDPGVWSQAYQDWYMFHQFFYGKQNGIYIEVGANHPFLLSNSAFFDICMGWKGICVEPSDVLAKEFENRRSCTMVKRCGWSVTQDNLKMLLRGGGTSIITDQQYQQQIAQNNAENVFSCDTISGFDLLSQYQPRNKFGEMADLNDVTDIDFISLDIEGAEEMFLKCFPFDKYNVHVW